MSPLVYSSLLPSKHVFPSLQQSRGSCVSPPLDVSVLTARLQQCLRMAQPTIQPSPLSFLRRKFQVGACGFEFSQACGLLACMWSERSAPENQSQQTACHISRPGLCCSFALRVNVILAGDTSPLSHAMSLLS